MRDSLFPDLLKTLLRNAGFNTLRKRMLVFQFWRFRKENNLVCLHSFRGKNQVYVLSMAATRARIFQCSLCSFPFPVGIKIMW